MNIHLNIPVRYLMTAVLASLIFFPISSCSRQIHFNTSDVVPAAEGRIKINKDNNNNYTIKINVLHLAAPSKLNPPKKTYVVWLETKEHGRKNIGQLTTSTGLFSNTLKGSLKTVTAYQPTRIFITAEDDGARAYPGFQEVLVSEPVK